MMYVKVNLHSRLWVYILYQSVLLAASNRNSFWLNEKSRKKAFVAELWNSSRTFQNNWNQTRKEDQMREAVPQAESRQNTSPSPPSGNHFTDPSLKNGCLSLPSNHRHRTSDSAAPATAPSTPLDSLLALPLYVTSSQFKVCSGGIHPVNPRPPACVLAAREAETMSGLFSF